MAEPGALLGRRIHPPLHRVHVHERQLTGAGQQRRVRGQSHQQPAARLLDLADVPPGQAAQERAQRGRRPHIVEHLVHAAVPQQVQVIDAVSARGHPATIEQTFAAGIGPTPLTDPDVLEDQARQATALGRLHHRHQTAISDDGLVVEHRMRLVGKVRQSHLRGALSDRVHGRVKNSHLPSSEGTSLHYRTIVTRY
ncbi:hypothetical protein [Actinomadura sp. 9N215]|uniref:hypothetical protein n=1 Tax=Actinomadura sp. 9N215 TaxID=3375150 RepID=UPI003796C649